MVSIRVHERSVEMLRQFAAWDSAALEAMTAFPLHRFDSPPIAYVPIHSATRERFVVAVEPDGHLSCVSPTIHAIHSAVDLLGDDAEVEDVTVAGIAFHAAELCVVMHDASQEHYLGHFLKAERTSLTPIGTSRLTPPDPEYFLCGVTHLGSGLCLVWSDASAQYYQPSKNPGGGLTLVRTFKLTDFDFTAMKKRAGTEEMRSVTAQLTVCSDLNVPGVVCVVGPRMVTSELKYVVLDVESGVVQQAGTLDEEIVGDAPIKVVPSATERGEFRLFVGEEDRGVKKLKMTGVTLATRIGMKSGNRKRKLEAEASVAEETSSPEREPTLQPPRWIDFVVNTKSGAVNSSFTDIPRNALKRICRSESEINGVTSGELSLDRRVRECLRKLKEALEDRRQDSSLVMEAIGVLEEWKESGKVLLVDLGGVVAEYIGGCCNDWTALRKALSLHRPECLTACPALPGVLLSAGEFDLFAKLISGIKHLRAEEYSALLQAILVSSADLIVSSFRVHALERLQGAASAALDAVDEVDTLSVTAYTDLKWKILSVADFSMSEVLLHSLVALAMDPCDLRRAMASLTPRQLPFVMTYLDKWFTLLKDEDVTAVDCVCGMECVRRIPSLRHVVDWIAALLSVHMDALIGDVTLLPILTKFRKGLEWVKTETRALISAEGLCREMVRPKSEKNRRIAPYQIEVFDLSIDRQ